MVNTLANLVHETTTGSGTGTLTLTSVTGWRTFNTAFGTGGTDLFRYGIRDLTTGDYEIGTGHLSDATTLVRDTVIESSNADALVNFATSNTKHLVCDIDAATLDGVNDAKLLGTIDASASATVDFDTGIDFTAYRTYRLVGSNIVFATDGVNPWLRLSADGGTSYLSGASDYAYVNQRADRIGASRGGNSGAAQIFMGFSGHLVGNVGGEHIPYWEINFDEMSNSSLFTSTRALGCYFKNDGVIQSYWGSAHRTTAQANDGIRFMASSGNVTSGSFQLFGIGRL